MPKWTDLSRDNARRGEIIQTDLDNIEDLTWWLKGYLDGHKICSTKCPVTEDRINSVLKGYDLLKENLNEKEI